MTDQFPAGDGFPGDGAAVPMDGTAAPMRDAAGDQPATDVAAVTARFGAELRDAGVPVDPGRCERFARAVTLIRPRTREELYACGLATLVSGPDQIEIYDRLFAAAFGISVEQSVPVSTAVPNPRTKSPRYRPEVSGMAAAWPYCNAVMSAHSLNAIDDLISALARSA